MSTNDKNKVCINGFDKLDDFHHDMGCHCCAEIKIKYKHGKRYITTHQGGAVMHAATSLVVLR